MTSSGEPASCQKSATVLYGMQTFDAAEVCMIDCSKPPRAILIVKTQGFCSIDHVRQNVTVKLNLPVLSTVLCGLLTFAMQDARCARRFVTPKSIFERR